MTRGIIYLILNKQNNHKYVGNTTLAMNKEWVHHIERSKRMSPEPLHKAFREFGVHNFMIKELDECEETEFESKTNYWIDKYQPEYNTIIEPNIEITPIPEPKVTPIPKPRRTPSYSHLTPFNEKTRSTGEHCGVKIRGKNMKTGEVFVWSSARKAAQEITGNPKKNSNILKAAREGYTYYNYKWLIAEPDKKKKKAIFGVNKKTMLIELRYDTIASCIRELSMTGNKSSLYKSLKNPGRFSWRGHYWFYV